MTGRASAASPRRVRLLRKALEDYRALVGDDLVAEIRELARPLRGARVLELSATATGGGVAELLSSLVPLECDLGIVAEWQVIAGDARFFQVTKRIHNGMQGMPIELSRGERREFLRHNEANARLLAGDWDLVVVHDPQPAAVCSFAPHLSRRWIWRCHIDSSMPHASVWEFLRPYVEWHDRAVFTLEAFIPPDLDMPTSLVLPAIDPITSKNLELPAYLARQTVAALGVDLSRPLLLQVSRFDPWKDPLGVVDVWRRAREHVPGLQLALVGSMATDDPEGWEIYQQIEQTTTHEPDVLLFTDQMGVASHEVNAFQRVADVAIQKSTREGFGLVVAETLWKRTAMVAGRAGGIPVQLQDDVGGYLAGSTDEFVDHVIALLEDPGRAREVGLAGAERVRDRFLLPRMLRDHLAVLLQVLSDGSP
jgi:trehalose synthase